MSAILGLLIGIVIAGLISGIVKLSRSDRAKCKRHRSPYSS